MANLAGNGGGLVLQDNGSDNLMVNSNGSFRFATPLPSGSAYSVTVFTQPSSPAQTCAATNATGKATTDVTTVKIDCGHNEWAWVAGSQNANQIGTYGTLGMPASGNTPGGRQYPATWVDSSRDLWLFGGYGHDTSGILLPINDLWKFSAGQWTWMAGSNVISQPGVYGTQGMAAANNIPGARQFGVTWTDSSGNAWLFGGNGFDAAGTAQWLNDLWRFSGGQWTWMSGSNQGSHSSNYGTQGILFPGNTPGGRYFLKGWVDPNGNLWLLGGYGESAGVLGNLNDLWMYMP